MAKSHGGGGGDRKRGKSENAPYADILHPQLSRGNLEDLSMVKMAKDSPAVLVPFNGGGGGGVSGVTGILAAHVSYYYPPIMKTLLCTVTLLKSGNGTTKAAKNN